MCLSHYQICKKNKHYFKKGDVTVQKQEERLGDFSVD